jgi:hypothetical protein
MNELTLPISQRRGETCILIWTSFGQGISFKYLRIGIFQLIEKVRGFFDKLQLLFRSRDRYYVLSPILSRQILANLSLDLWDTHLTP